MEIMLLKDKNVHPSDEVLLDALKDVYPVYEEMVRIITGELYGLLPQWNYYNDGKAWLCKVNYKKTVFWLSVWEGYFKAGFYFTEKHFSGIRALDIDQSIKDEFFSNKPFGKLYPLTFVISRKEQLTDLLKVIEYKKSIK